MIPELGHFALILAAAIATVQFVAPLVGYARRDSRLMALGQTGAQAQFAVVFVAFVALTVAFVRNDFSVVNVAANSHSELPIHYRITAVWGSHEGSFLLWTLILAGWGLAVSIFNRGLPAPVSALVLSTLGGIGIGFYLFMLLTSNPFARQFPVPLEGQDLNPLLQDPGMIVHPPMLYMGYVGMSVAFAFAIAALITGKLDAAWARWTRPWTTTAWLFLTLGITIGSWWAYNELGWGGWWFWDPTENASFMPWLVCTALIHSLAVTEKRGVLKAWTILLAIVAFALSLLGTFLVRSGVLVSVHAFATDPARGVFVLGFLATIVGSALTLYAWRVPKLVSEAEVPLMAREGLLLLNNVFLICAAAAILLGTLYPLVIDALGLGKVSVGPPYFNAVFLPLVAPLAVLLGVSALVPWKRARWAEIRPRLLWPALLAAIAAAVVPFALQGSSSVLAAAGVLMATWVAAGVTLDLWQRVRLKQARLRALAQIPRGNWGMMLAHLGVAVWTLGVTFTSLYSVEKDVRLGPGESAEVGPYLFRFHGVKRSEGPNYQADLGAVTVLDGERHVAELTPEKRFYPSKRQVMTEAAVDHSPMRDLYVALGEPIGDQDWSLRVYHKPLMRLVWIGGLLMFAGGILAASDRRYRLRRAAEQRLPAAAATG